MAERQLADLERYARKGQDGRKIGDLDKEIVYLRSCVDLARRAVLGRNDAKLCEIVGGY